MIENRGNGGEWRLWHILIILAALVLLAGATWVYFHWREFDGRSQFIGAAACGDLQSLRYFMDVRGFDPNDTSFGNTTPIIHAAQLGQAEAISLLIASGANVNAMDGMGRPALMYAVMNMHTGCVVQLLEAGADPNVTDRFGDTALDYTQEDDRIGRLLTVNRSE